MESQPDDDHKTMDLHNNQRGRGVAQNGHAIGQDGRNYSEWWCHVGADGPVFVGGDNVKWWVRVK